MGNKSKQDKGASRQMNDYEKIRLLRIKENQARLRDFGVKSIAKSLTSLVESKKSKKKKKKVKASYADGRDVEYNPDLSEDSEGDYQEVATSVDVSKKQHHAQYIAPLSMNRVANLAKTHRVIAPKVPDMIPLESNATKDNQSRAPLTMGEFISSNKGQKRQREVLKQNVGKPDRIPRGERRQFDLFDEDDETHRVIASKVPDKIPLESNATKDNQSRAPITMGEFISSNKGQNGQTKVLKQNVGKPHRITSRARKQLDLFDEDDDKENEISHNVNGVDMEQDGQADDENEGHTMRFQDDDVDQDDEYEDMDLMEYENNENEIQGDDSEDVENENDALLQEQLDGPELEKATAIHKPKKRGATMMHVVHARKANEREVIICNEFGQPVGPVTKEKDIVGQFSRFFGTIARSHSYAPLIHNSWHKVPDKDKIWEYVLQKYDVPDDAKTWVLKTIGQSYKVYKCRFKKKQFYDLKDNKTRWKKRPKSIPREDFQKLLTLWNKKNVANRCLRAKEIRMSQKNMHTAGLKSFARIRDEMKNDDPNKELPSLTQLFERTRKRTEGRAYVDTYDDTARKIEQMKNYKSPEDGSVSVDPFMAVMSKNVMDTVDFMVEALQID